MLEQLRKEYPDYLFSGFFWEFQLNNVMKHIFLNSKMNLLFWLKLLWKVALL